MIFSWADWIGFRTLAKKAYQFSKSQKYASIYYYKVSFGSRSKNSNYSFLIIVRFRCLSGYPFLPIFRVSFGAEFANPKSCEFSTLVKCNLNSRAVLLQADTLIKLISGFSFPSQISSVRYHIWQASFVNTAKNGWIASPSARLTSRPKTRVGASFVFRANAFSYQRVSLCKFAIFLSFANGLLSDCKKTRHLFFCICFLAICLISKKKFFLSACLRCFCTWIN